MRAFAPSNSGSPSSQAHSPPQKTARKTPQDSLQGTPQGGRLAGRISFSDGRVPPTRFNTQIDRLTRTRPFCQEQNNIMWTPRGHQEQDGNKWTSRGQYQPPPNRTTYTNSSRQSTPNIPWSTSANRPGYRAPNNYYDDFRQHMNYSTTTGTKEDELSSSRENVSTPVTSIDKIFNRNGNWNDERSASREPSRYDDETWCNGDSTHRASRKNEFDNNTRARSSSRGSTPTERRRDDRSYSPNHEGKKCPRGRHQSPQRYDSPHRRLYSENHYSENSRVGKDKPSYSIDRNYRDRNDNASSERDSRRDDSPNSANGHGFGDRNRVRNSEDAASLFQEYQSTIIHDDKWDQDECWGDTNDNYRSHNEGYHDEWMDNTKASVVDSEKYHKAPEPNGKAAAYFVGNSPTRHALAEAKKGLLETVHFFTKSSARNQTATRRDQTGTRNPEDPIPCLRSLTLAEASSGDELPTGSNESSPQPHGGDRVNDQYNDMRMKSSSHPKGDRISPSHQYHNNNRMKERRNSPQLDSGLGSAECSTPREEYGDYERRDGTQDSRVLRSNPYVRDCPDNYREDATREVLCPVSPVEDDGRNEDRDGRRSRDDWRCDDNAQFDADTSRVPRTFHYFKSHHRPASPPRNSAFNVFFAPRAPINAPGSDLRYRSPSPHRRRAAAFPAYANSLQDSPDRRRNGNEEDSPSKRSGSEVEEEDANAIERLRKDIKRQHEDELAKVKRREAKIERREMKKKRTEALEMAEIVAKVERELIARGDPSEPRRDRMCTAEAMRKREQLQWEAEQKHGDREFYNDNGYEYFLIFGEEERNKEDTTEKLFDKVANWLWHPLNEGICIHYVKSGKAYRDKRYYPHYLRWSLREGNCTIASS